jgi:serine-type D-Ala-D-Ala carboxypeptidase (penicillin-binding protein 5/6)
MSRAARAGAVLVAALLVVLLGAPARAHARAPDCPAAVSAPSAIVMEVSTGTVVCARAPDRRRPIASTTKLMTALLTLERARLSATFIAADYRPLAIESQIGLLPGERMKVRDLLRGLLVESANDAAVTLADGISRSTRAFVKAMNARARALGLRNTHYANPIGLDAPGNWSSARDLVLLATVLRTNPVFKAIVDLPRVTLRSGARPRTFLNRNDLVRRFDWVNGVKTGHTRGAGYVLVGSAARHGVQVVSAVLATTSEAARDADTLLLLRRALGRFRAVRSVVEGRSFAAVPVKTGDGDGAPGGRLRLLATRTVRRVVPIGEPGSVRLRVVAPRDVQGPIRRGRRLGRVEVRQGGRLVATVPLVAARRVAAPAPSGAGAGWVLPALVLIGLAAVAGSVLRTRRRRALRPEARHREAPAA